jgi:hypothetical protein
MRDLTHAQASPVSAGAHLLVDPNRFRSDFDRLPFGYEHDLSGIDLLTFDAIKTLAGKFERDFYVAAGAETPGTKFYSVSHGAYSPLEALERLDSVNQRVLLKRPEMYDERYGDLLQTLFKQVVEMRGGLRGERVVRLASSILVSSAAAITPFHFDPEISFFFQIEGEKIYHLYDPAVLREDELERFYSMGIVDIGQVDLQGRDASREHVFRLVGGKGMHQPQNCPHWVETRVSRSISYVFSFETDATRSRGRTRAFNYYQRRLGLRPGLPGKRPAVDGLKSAAMRVSIPLRKRVGETLRAVAPKR